MGGTTSSRVGTDQHTAGIIIGCIFGAIIGPIVLYHMSVVACRIVHKVRAVWRMRKLRKAGPTPSGVEKGEAPAGDEEKDCEIIDPRTVRAVVDKDRAEHVEKEYITLTEKETKSDPHDEVVDRRRQETEVPRRQVWMRRFMTCMDDDGLGFDTYP